MPTAESQRDFLETVTDDAQPVTYVCAGLTHSVYVTRVTELAPFKFEGRLEPLFQLRMVATLPEATGYSPQEQFLLDAANDIEPLMYTDGGGDQHYVVLTRLAKSTPFKSEERFEPVYQVTLADARAVMSVQSADGVGMQTSASVNIYTHRAAKWGEFLWGFAQWS